MKTAKNTKHARFILAPFRLFFFVHPPGTSRMTGKTVEIELYSTQQYKRGFEFVKGNGS
jgi:hypothetical protein